VIFFFKTSGWRWKQSLTDFQGKQAVNVAWLLVHSTIASRLSSSSDSCRLHRNDHDRANGAQILHRFCGTLCAGAAERTLEPLESSQPRRTRPWSTAELDLQSNQRASANCDCSKLVLCIHCWRRPRHPRTHAVPSVDTLDGECSKTKPLLSAVQRCKFS